MKTKVLKLELGKMPAKDSAGNPIPDPIGTRITKAYDDASMAGLRLVAAYETTDPDAKPPAKGPTHLMLFFQQD